MKSVAVLLGLVACAPDPQHPKLDGGGHATDAAKTIDMATSGAELPAGPYKHAIAIDGTDDFTTGETFGTTSTPGYAARVTWDDTNVYVGYSGPDIASGSTTKWVFAYVDVDPGGATGAAAAELYRTQASTFPTGFGAELYARWKCDDSLATIEVFDGQAWSTSPTALAHARTADFVEFAIPRALLPDPTTTIGIATYMINEQDQLEGTYAGIYADNFTDGYDKPLAKYLRADFTSSLVPSDPANEKP